MKEELHDRIQHLLDGGEGLTLDETLDKALEEAGEEARGEAEALARVDALLRGFAEVELSDDAAEAIATRIEQRLDEDLARIPDPVEAPIFSDEDGQPPKKAQPPKPPKKKAGNYSLANLTSLSVKDAPAVKPDAPLRRPPQKPVVRESQVEMMEADELGLEELPDSAPPPAGESPAAAAGPAEAAAPAAAKQPTKISDERASIPSVPPFDLKGAEETGDLPPPPVDLEEARARRRTIFYWGSGLAAAAAVLVVAVTGLSTMSSPAEEDAVAMVSPEPAATAEMAMEESEVAYRSAEPAPAPGEGAALGAEADQSVASTETAAVVEMPEAEAEPTEEEEAEDREASTSAPSRSPSTGARARRSRMAAQRPAPAMARAGGGGASMATPTRDQVLRAMRAVQPRVSACGNTRHGTVQVNVTVSGSSGRVRNAVVQGEFAGTREGSCVARAVRRARFPEFRRDSFSFTYPFRI